jgi:hypothetical protein
MDLPSRRVFCLLLALLTLLAPLRVGAGTAADCCDGARGSIPMDHPGDAMHGDPQDSDDGCPCDGQCDPTCLHGAQPAAAIGLTPTNPLLPACEHATLLTAFATLASLPPTPPPRTLRS